MPVQVSILPTPHSARTRRSIVGAGCEVVQDNPQWLLQAGCWLPRGTAPVLPPLPEDGPFIGIGATLELCGTPGSLPQPVSAWRQVLQQCGGNLTHHAALLPEPASLLLNAAARDQVSSTMPGEVLRQAIAQGWRIVRLDALDVCHDERPRVLQVVTSIQRGGAERLALDLHEELPRHGVACHLLSLGMATRGAFAVPPGMLSLAHLPADAETRAREIARIARLLGCDLVHAHLLNGETLASLRAHGIPVVTTVHNQRAGWPAGLDALRAEDADLLMACSQAVEAELVGLPVPSRTIWNGIRLPSVPPDARLGWRQRAGFGEGDLILVTLANPRPQKQLPLLIAVLRAVRERVAPRQARLILAGEASSRDPTAAEETRRFWDAVDAHDLRTHVFWPGAVEDTAGFLAAADVFVSTSAHEGLSLAQLEALAVGLPVVTTDVGGAREVAREHPQMWVVEDGGPDFLPRFAECCPEAARGTNLEIRSTFTTPVMTARHRWLYHCVLSQERRRHLPRRGVLLLANNFSTGGAQSSARRLLCALHQRGEPVRAAVIQEEAGNSTPGHTALLAAGIPVLALPTPEGRDPTDILLPLLESIADDPPAAVLLWNVIPSCKLLLADALWDIPVFEVSPGEMLFDSLEKCFANPRPGLPYREGHEYGRRLAGVVVKYATEKARAEAVFGKEVHVIPNGVELPPPRQPHHHPCPVIGTAARLNPQKKLEDLLAAFRLVHEAMPEVVLRIAGGEERGFEAYAASLRASVHDLPVEWLGDVQDIAAFHAGLDVFAMISEPSGCPNASLEAMAAGLPVVATAVGGAADQVVDGITGSLTPRGDAAAMSSALLHLLRDGPLRQHFGEAARQRIRKHFSMEQMVESYRALCFVNKVES